MPIYTYRCQACENVLEKRQSFSEDALTTCQQCGGELRKVLHPVGIVFKGSGFYNTDYRASNGAAAKDSDDKGGDKTESGEASTSTSDTSKTSASDSKSDGEKPAASKSDTSPGSATKATAGAGSAKSE
ncbi:MAG: FmdB family transcriptional regulator [Chloroflexi bacterium]|nr:FmdB family transcriptional regulator [Chloroflexota bacterium]